LTVTSNEGKKIDMKTSNVPKNPDKRRVWIKHELEKRGLSYATIARDESVSRQAVWKAVRVPSPKMERIIAGRLGRRPEEIWPERYAS
jgi:Ner family transcriptional regulator